MIFFGNDRDFSRLVALPDGPGRLQTGNTASQDEILSVCVVLITAACVTCGDKVLGTYAADRAYFQGRIENSAADQALDQLMSAFCRLLLLFFEKDTAEIVTKIIRIRELIVVRFEADAEAVQDLQADLFESLNEVRNALTGPTVASESGSKSSLVDRRIHAESQAVNRLQSLAEDGGRAEQITVCRRHIRSQIGLVIKYQIIAVNFRSGIFDALRDHLRELFR